MDFQQTQDTTHCAAEVPARIQSVSVSPNDLILEKIVVGRISGKAAAPVDPDTLPFVAFNAVINGVDQKFNFYLRPYSIFLITLKAVSKRTDPQFFPF